MAQAQYKVWLDEEHLVLLRNWAREGYKDEEIADMMGIHVGTLYSWKNKYSDINNALKKGKEIIDGEVEEALIKSALGYTVHEKKITELPDGTYKKELSEKHIPPNVTALIFWLKNRRSKSWRDKQKEEIDTTMIDKLDNILKEVKEDAIQSVKKEDNN